jgi:hypothetical protein
VAWQPVSIPDSCACPPDPVDVFGAVLNGGNPNACAASASEAASAAAVAAAALLRLLTARA